jgi:hypothetical protein
MNRNFDLCSEANAATGGPLNLTYLSKWHALDNLHITIDCGGMILHDIPCIADVLVLCERASNGTP